MSQMQYELNRLPTTPPRDLALLISFRFPTIDDGFSIWSMAKASTELDVNSAYLYWLWCRDFHETTVVILAGTTLVGFAAGFMRPTEPNTLFIWQVSVAPQFRRRGLAMRALAFLIANVGGASPVSYVEATVTPANENSHGLFRSLALALEADHREDLLFAENFDHDGHPREVLHRIGPIRRDSLCLNRVRRILNNA
jgi:L-2,4-diaminobutyric acid acetyltransferase